MDKAEQYQQELECDRELYKVIALDAKGVPQSRITARHAANLLAEEVAQRAGEPMATANEPQRQSPAEKTAAALRTDTDQQPVVAQH